MQLPELTDLHVHDHPCSLYETGDDLKRGFVPFLRAGLALGERCIYFIDENTRQFVIDAMADEFELGPYMERGAFQIIRTQDAHLAHGFFDEQKMVAYWSQALSESQKDGFKALRAAVEMTWALSGSPGCEQLAPYEARLNGFTSKHSVSVLCQYSRAKFSAEKLKAVIHAHPMLVVGEEVLPNPACVHADRFIEGDHGLDVQATIDNLTLIKRLQSSQAELERTQANLTVSNDALKRAFHDLRIAHQEAVSASKLKSQLVANVSHEIRTPMAGIIGMAEMLTHDQNLSGDQQEIAQHLFKASNRLLDVLNDLLDFAKLDAGHVTLDFGPVQPDRLLGDVVDSISPVTSKKDLIIETDIDPALPASFIGDETKLRQALLNLAHNAVKFTDTGFIRLSANRDGDEVIRFTLTDSGVGIPADEQLKVFEPFYQVDGSLRRRQNGTGLGLSITKRFIELMGGQIGCESKAGQGSVFWFTVPLKTMPHHPLHQPFTPP